MPKPRLPKAAPRRDKIVVSQLAVDCVVGTLPRERKKPQRILLDITLHADLSRAGASDDLAHAPDYARAARIARAFCVARRALLLETLAEGIARRLLIAFPVDAVTTRVTKPSAIPGAAGASVQIHRTRHAKRVP